MSSFVAVEVFCNCSGVLLLCILRGDGRNYSRNETFNLLPFPGLPEEVGNIESESLDKKSHPDPLVEAMVDCLFLRLLAPLQGTDTRLEDVRPRCVVREGEGGVGPTKGIEDSARHTLQIKIGSVLGDRIWMRP